MCLQKREIGCLWLSLHKSEIGGCFVREKWDVFAKERNRLSLQKREIGGCFYKRETGCVCNTEQ